MDWDCGTDLALITGGSAGIGLATARASWKKGAAVAICARGAERLATRRRHAASAPRGRRSTRGLATCNKPDQVAAWVEGAAADLGGVDVLVNNAGQGRFLTFRDTTDEQWRHELDLKFFSIIHPVRAAYPYLRARGGGAIVVVNAVLARRPEPHMVSPARRGQGC